MKEKPKARIILFDLETSGLDFNKHNIVELDAAI